MSTGAAPDEPPMGRRRWLRLLRFCAAILLGFYLVFGTFACALQRKIIYYPRDYGMRSTEMLYTPGMRRLTVQTGEGAQHAYVMPAPESSTSGTILLLFGGNASLALAWVEEALEFQRADPALTCVLVEYPGYGDNEGAPSRAAILESFDALHPALLADLSLTADQLAERSAVLGHSLGAATALEWAARFGARDVVLLSPFTSLLDMARLTVPWPLHYLLLDRFDNEARLSELLQRGNHPAIAIRHGTADDIVPERMGAKLGKIDPKAIDYRALPGVDHNTIADVLRKELAAHYGRLREGKAPGKP